ncbi:hypothetical protein BV25DRAFT_292436 [Artomyces pyxidatus]|uniref:Uncharacterized protein n=1 Tax=Artomyces pyxidatus TaxID=48021 RepID=A0ACB8SF01_9AGAM|nr:hypothetical protein BV25DRAFT_292436 [Artomyces pyxidatus]
MYLVSSLSVDVWYQPLCICRVRSPILPLSRRVSTYLLIVALLSPPHSLLTAFKRPSGLRTRIDMVRSLQLSVIISTPRILQGRHMRHREYRPGRRELPGIAQSRRTVASQMSLHTTTRPLVNCCLRRHLTMIDRLWCVRFSLGIGARLYAQIPLSDWCQIFSDGSSYLADEVDIRTASVIDPVFVSTNGQPLLASKPTR